MSSASKRSFSVLNISFYILALMLAVTPLIFLKDLNNGYELAKAASIKMLGGCFIIVSVVYLNLKLFDSKNKEQFLFIDKCMDPAAVIFLLAALLSTVFSLNPYISYYGEYERQIGFLSYLYVFFIYFFASQVLQDSRKIQAVLNVMEITGVLVAISAILQILGLGLFGITVASWRANATFGNAIFAGGFLIMVYPIALIECFKSDKKLLRAISPLVILAGIVVTQTRTAYVACFIETVIVLLIYTGLFKAQKPDYSKLIRNGLIIFGAAALLIIFLVIIFPDNPFVKRILKITDIIQSPRWYLWRDSFKAFWLHPFLGSGIGTFQNVFEYVVTPETRMMEVNNHFDNAHNNFLQFLCTMGIAGILAYLLVLFRSFRMSFKLMRDEASDKTQKVIALALIALICGYVIYGMADFDDLPILLYLTAVMTIIKVSFARVNSSQLLIDPKKILRFKIPIIIFSSALAGFSAYNIYDSYTELKADIYFKQALDYTYAGNFSECVKALNTAVLLKPGCPDYRFTLAYDVYEYCSVDTKLTSDAKNNLLLQAETELNKAKVNLYSNLQYEALLTMIYYEMGKINEADSLRDKVLAADSTLMSFRNNLVRYYFKSSDYQKMSGELDFIYSCDPDDESAEQVELFYYMKMNDLTKAELICEKILKAHPVNKTANLTLAEIKKKEKGSP